MDLEINNLSRDKTCDSDVTVSRFLDALCEFMPANARNELTWFADCDAVWSGYLEWTRRELKAVPVSKQEFWDALKDRVTVFRGIRGDREVTQFIGMRFHGYRLTLGGRFTFKRFRGTVR